MATKKKFALPKSLAACADLMYSLREKRYAMQKEVDEVAAQESALREHLINNLPKSSATGISGKLANARIELKQTIQVEDWDKLTKYIIKNASKGAFALMQRRVSESAVREIWESRKQVPGVKPFDVPVVSLTKR